jgi:hypothetical protein
MYYLLCLRLSTKQPTIFQSAADYVLLFDEEGVRRISTKAAFHDVVHLLAPKTWALVDANKGVESPAELLAGEASTCFVVVASSPRPSRWVGLEKYKAPMQMYFMEPYTLSELFQASVPVICHSFAAAYFCLVAANFKRTIVCMMSEISNAFSSCTAHQPVTVTHTARTYLHITTASSMR